MRYIIIILPLEREEVEAILILRWKLVWIPERHCLKPTDQSD